MSDRRHNESVKKHYQQTTSFYERFWSWGVSSLHAGFYDRNHLSPASAMVNTNKVLASLVKITQSDRVLDAGCGVGGSTVWMAKNTGARVFGINLSPLQIEKAKRLAEKNSVGKIVIFKTGDYCNSKFPNKFFSVVWALESVCHATDKKAFLQEANRLLKPGGRLIVSDGFLTIPQERLPTTLRWLLGIFERGYNLGKLVSLEEFKDFLIKTGFRKVRFIDKSAAVRPNWWLGLLICLFCLPAWPLMILVGRPEIVRLGITGIMQPFGELLGIGKYGIFLATK